MELWHDVEPHSLRVQFDRSRAVVDPQSPAAGLHKFASTDPN